jgi:hypothetical protein
MTTLIVSVRGIAMSLSKQSDVARVLETAKSPGWTLRLDGSSIVAEHDSGVEGLPWTVVARRGGRGMRVSLYQPGDDTSIEGVELGEVAGPARDMGRQLRGLLEDAPLESAL